jgi:hypothetical protein
MPTKKKTDDDNEVEVDTQAVTASTKDYLGRLLVTPGTNSKDYLGRLTTATADHMGRLLI